MITRFKQTMATPITWGAYWKFSLICAAISGAISWIIYKAGMNRITRDAELKD